MFQVCKDGSEDFESVLSSNSFSSFIFITVSNGQYFKFLGCTAYLQYIGGYLLTKEGKKFLSDKLSSLILKNFASPVYIASVFWKTTSNVFHFKGKVQNYTDVSFLEIMRCFLDYDYQEIVNKVNAGNYADDDLIKLKSILYKKS